MAVWKYASKEVSEEEIDKAINAVAEACFKCGKENHTDECPIFQLIEELKALKGSKGR